MRLAVASFMFWTVTVLSSMDFITIADKFGVPVAFSGLIYVLLTRQIKSRDAESAAYRSEMLQSTQEQTAFLKELVRDSRKCKFVEIGK